MFKKNIAIAIAGLVLSSSVYSNNKLGMLKINSKRHEPFDATILVKHQKGRDLETMRAQLGSIVDFYRHNLEPSLLNSNLSFSVKNKNEYEKIIHVTSEAPISTEVFGFVVRLYDDTEKAFGVYKFVPPVVDMMENVELKVCNDLNWDKNKECMQTVNTALAMATRVEPKEQVKVSGLDDLITSKDDFYSKKNKKVQNSKKERSEKLKEKKLALEQEKKRLAEIAQEKHRKTVDKERRARLRQRLKPHMSQETSDKFSDLPNSGADKVSEKRENLKPQIFLKKNQQDTISRGVVKFTEILDVTTPDNLPKK